jgi:hypothetical protein
MKPSISSYDTSTDAGEGGFYNRNDEKKRLIINLEIKYAYELCVFNSLFECCEMFGNVKFTATGLHSPLNLSLHPNEKLTREMNVTENIYIYIDISLLNMSMTS